MRRNGCQRRRFSSRTRSAQLGQWAPELSVAGSQCLCDDMIGIEPGSEVDAMCEYACTFAYCKLATERQTPGSFITAGDQESHTLELPIVQLCTDCEHEILPAARLTLLRASVLVCCCATDLEQLWA